MTPDELAEIEANNIRLSNLINDCARSGARWSSPNKCVDALMRYLNDVDTFPGRAVCLLLDEVRFLQLRIVELTSQNAVRGPA